MTRASPSLRLFALGSNGAGQLGIGHRDDVSTPEECHFDPEATLAVHETILDLRAGGNHTLVLTSHGRVFAAGSTAAFGADDAELTSFYLLDLGTILGLERDSKVTNIAASWDSSYFVIDHKVVYACGRGNKGELGLGEGRQSVTVPQLVFNSALHNQGNVMIQDIAAGMGHVVLITTKGEVYGWGASRKGQLGADIKESKIVWTPIKIDLDFSATRVAVGRDFTFVRGEENEQVLLGDKTKFPGNGILDLSPTVSIFSGWSNLYALDSGDLQAIGRNDRGQVPKIKLPVLNLFAAGSEHCVACTGEGEVLAFGWGEHGNCGEPTDVRGNVAGRFNMLTVPKTTQESVYFLGAGCATTFIALKSSQSLP